VIIFVLVDVLQKFILAKFYKMKNCVAYRWMVKCLMVN